MSNEAVAERLSTLRRAVSGENQTAFAARLGIDFKRWNNFERGIPLSKQVAILLVQKIPGVTLDWLYLGKADGLPGTLRLELEAAAAMDTTSATKAGRGR